MRIAICSTQCNGKTTLVNAVKEKWPMYVSPEKTYRELIKEKNLIINRQGTVESQTIIRDALFEQAHNESNHKFSVQDRTILDNLVYTMYLYQKELDEMVKSDVEHDTTFTDEYINDSILMCRDAMKKYDIIFWLPLNNQITLDDLTNPNRDIDPTFRIEIDNIFQSIFECYRSTGTTIFFDLTDQPAIIALEGDVDQKLATISTYIGVDGNLIEEESVLASLEDEYDKLQLLKEFEQTMK